jgi:hypothetical protein
MKIGANIHNYYVMLSKLYKTDGNEVKEKMNLIIVYMKMMIWSLMARFIVLKIVLISNQRKLRKITKAAKI